MTERTIIEQTEVYELLSKIKTTKLKEFVIKYLKKIKRKTIKGGGVIEDIAVEDAELAEKIKKTFEKLGYTVYIDRSDRTRKISIAWGKMEKKEIYDRKVRGVLYQGAKCLAVGALLIGAGKYLWSKFSGVKDTSNNWDDDCPC